MVVVVAGAGLAYLFASYPDVPPAGTVTLPASPDVVARGKYLAEHVAICIDCHSERDFTRFAGPIKPGTFGKGGERFDGPTAGIPGVIYAPNITPAGHWRLERRRADARGDDRRLAGRPRDVPADAISRSTASWPKRT